jgi:hypothetical protein
MSRLFSRPYGTFQLVHANPGLRPGLSSARAVQISGLVDSVGLILLDKRVLRPGNAKPGWGSGAADLQTCCPNVCDKAPAYRPIQGFKTGASFQLSQIMAKNTRAPGGAGHEFLPGQGAVQKDNSTKSTGHGMRTTAGAIRPLDWKATN